jgi:hypothetical protein
MDADRAESEITRLTDLTLVDEELARQLRDAGYETVEHVAGATPEQLQHIDGIHRGFAARLAVETSGTEPSQSVLETVREIHESVTDDTEGEPGDQPDFDRLTDIAIVDRELARRLRRAGYRTVEDVSLAETEELARIDGIRKAVAARLTSVTDGIAETDPVEGSDTETSVDGNEESADSDGKVVGGENSERLDSVTEDEQVWAIPISGARRWHYGELRYGCLTDSPLADHPLLVFPLFLTEFVLLDLAGRGRGECFDVLDLSDDLVVSEPLTRERGQLLPGDRRVLRITVRRDDKGLRRLTPPLAGCRDHGDVTDGSVIEQRIFEFDTRDVLTTRDDDIFLSVLDCDHPVVVDSRQIARVVVAVDPVVERFLRGLGFVPVPVHHLVAPDDDLADCLVVAGNVVTVLVDDTDLGPEIAQPLPFLDGEPVGTVVVEVSPCV